MKTKVLITLCILFAFTIGCTNSKYKKPNEIRVLYLGGGNCEWSNGKYGSAKTFATEEDFQENIKGRMDAFGQMLNTYFDSVTVMNAADYTPSMSEDYDVTIIDGLIPALEKRQIIYDENGNFKDIIYARYFPDNYDCPTITIGSMGEEVGRRYGSKNDWLCLCLDAHAYNMNTKHPIFKGPFRTKITLTKEATPEDAFHYKYFQDDVLPDSVMMWRVQTIGYKSDPNFNAGMVTRPWGYLDSPDCEYISGGVSMKTFDAVAIGRHANFMTWGFVASPLHMTEEAKTVFANAVVYMSKFKGQTPIARKFNDRIATREYLKELKYLASDESYQSYVKSNEEYRLEQLENYNAAKAKKAKGQKLTEEDKYWLEKFNPDEVEEYTYADHLKRYQKEDLYNLLGEDENAYIKYYNENEPYLYGGEGMYKLTIDEDAKYWQIPNNDKRLIDKAITCLENGQEVARAKRVLQRYTLCNFKTPAEWRKWYDKYNKKMFFTESGGWFFLIDGPVGTPGNDYSMIEKREKEAEMATADDGNNLSPDTATPVVISPKARTTGNNAIEVSMDMKILAGFHVYNKVGQTDPYIPLQIEFNLPEGCKTKGDVIMPPAKKFGNNGTTIYEDEVKLLQVINYTSLPKNIKLKVSFQCCDSHVCMPPQEKEFNLPVKNRRR